MRTLAVSLALIGTAGMSVRLGAQSTGCAETQYPPELPPPSALVDSVHAIADLAPFAGPKPMVFSLVFQRGDSVAQVRPLDKNDAAAAVSLANYLRRQPPRDLWAVRVRIAGGDTPALTLERSKYCPPVSRNGDMPYGTRMIARVPIAQSGNPSPIPSEPMTVPAGAVVPAEAIISVEGRVVVARVMKSSGNPQTDAWIVHDLQRRKFEPAKLDGQPIQAVYRPAGESPRP